jgi:hypothetical protein
MISFSKYCKKNCFYHCKYFCPTLPTLILSLLQWYMTSIEHIKKLAQANPGILRKIHFRVLILNQTDSKFSNYQRLGA